MGNSKIMKAFKGEIYIKAKQMSVIGSRLDYKLSHKFEVNFPYTHKSCRYHHCFNCIYTFVFKVPVLSFILNLTVYGQNKVLNEVTVTLSIFHLINVYFYLLTVVARELGMHFCTYILCLLVPNVHANIL